MLATHSISHLAILAVSRRGARLAARLQAHLGGEIFVPGRFRDAVGSGPWDGSSVHAYGPGGVKAALTEAFPRSRGIVLILPIGAAVRLLAPLLQDKRSDPGIVVLDEAGAHAVALLSGHAGGGNTLARQVAAVVGGQPVITTASEVLGSLALDLLGKEHGWRIEEPADLTRASAALLGGDTVGAYQDAGDEGWWRDAPANVTRYPSVEALAAAPVAARLVISDSVPAWPGDALTPTLSQREREPVVASPSGRGRPKPRASGARTGEGVSRAAVVLYRPRTLVVGLGCVRGATPDELDALVRGTLEGHGLALACVCELATITTKRDERGITELAERHGWALRYFSAEELAKAGAPSGASEAVARTVGAPGVCEPAALLASGAETLLVPKTATRRATVAVARAVVPSARGHLAIVGIGPGAREHLTEAARCVLEDAEAIVGYHGYLDQVRPWLGPKTYHGSAIGQETERADLAIALSRAGRAVALVSSGDAGVYGTAGVVLERLAQAGADEEAAAVEVVPGVSAAMAAAALLGAPLMNDFAAISLSDLLTPWPTIERRLEAAAAADLVIALYNPASSQRRRQISRAREILLRHRPPSTPIGIVRNAYRTGQEVTVTDLEDMLENPIDMLTIVLIGNSATVRVGSRLTTQRGYGDTPFGHRKWR